MNEDVMSKDNIDNSEYLMSSIAVYLKNAHVLYADINPKLMWRVVNVICEEEFTTIVDTIATAVKNLQDQA